MYVPTYVLWLLYTHTLTLQRRYLACQSSETGTSPWRHPFMVSSSQQATILPRQWAAVNWSPPNKIWWKLYATIDSVSPLSNTCWLSALLLGTKLCTSSMIRHISSTLFSFFWITPRGTYGMSKAKRCCVVMSMVWARRLKIPYSGKARQGQIYSYWAFGEEKFSECIYY